MRGHQKSHAYRVMDILDFPLFDVEWGADEELLLIEGLEMFGIGNWEQISEHLGGTKSKYECCLHYVKTYIETQHWPLPDMTKEFDLESTRRSRKRLLDSVADKEKKSLINKGPIKYNKPPTSAPTNHEIAGFMPGRHEFETEYDNDAEQYVKDMVFDENESEEDVLLKTTILDIYNTALDRRSDRKKFIFDRGLLDFKKIQLIDKKRPKEEKELHQKARPFARIQTAADYDSFVDGLLAESRLRQRIAQLQEYRLLGITTMKEASEYEKDKINRLNNLKLTAGRDIYYLQHHERAKYTAAAVAAANASVNRPPSNSTNAPNYGANESVVKAPSRASTPSRLQSSFSSSSANNEATSASSIPHASSTGVRPGAAATTTTTLSNTSSFTAATTSFSSSSSANAVPQASSSVITISPTSSSGAGLGVNASPSSSDSGGGAGLGPSGSNHGLMNLGSGADNNLANARKDSAPLDISQSEGYELLSPQEQTLCTSLRLLPRAYLVIKETLISEYQKKWWYLKEAHGKEFD